MKRLRILTIMVVAALGIGAALSYAQYIGGNGAGWGVGTLSSAIPDNAPLNTNVKILRAGWQISSISEDPTLNLVNVTLSAPYPNNNLKVGQKIVISGTTNYNTPTDDAFIITVVTDWSHFSYAQIKSSRATETAGTAGGDYSSLITWESSAANTTIECYNDWGATGLQENLTISDNSATSTDYKKITVPLSERNNGTTGTGFKLAGTVTVGDSYAAIEDIEITGLVTVSGTVTGGLTTGGNVLLGGGVTIESLAVLNADTSNMVVNGGTFSLVGTVNAQGSLMTFNGATVNFATGTFNPGQASLVFSGTSSWTTLSASTPQYKTVRFASGTTTITGTPYIVNRLILDTGAGGAVDGGTITLYGDLICNSGAGGTTAITMIPSCNFAQIRGPASGSPGKLPATLTINKSGAVVTAFGTLTFQDVNVTAGTLEFRGDTTFTIVATKTMTVSSGATVVFAGPTMQRTLKLRSDTTGSRWNLANSGTVTPTYMDVKDCNGTGTAVSATAAGNIDGGNNVNWTFNTNTTTSYYNAVWTGAYDTNWSDGRNWSTGVVPNSYTCVTFTNTYNNNCTLTAAVGVNGIISTGYTGTLDTANWGLTIYGFYSPYPGLYWNSGTIKANSSTIIVKSTLSLSGGTFIPDSSTMQIYSDSSGNTTYIASDIPNFNILEFKAGADVKLGATITVGATSTLKFSGTSASLMTMNYNGTAPAPAGPQWYIDNRLGGTVIADYVSPTSCNVITGGDVSRKITAIGSLDKGNNTNWIFASAPIYSAIVTPQSLVAGSKGKVTVGFETRMTSIPGNCIIELTFPSGFTLGSDVSLSAQSLDGTFSTSVSGQTVTLTRTGGTTRTTNFYSELGWTIVLDNVTNPPAACTTDSYGIIIKNSGGTVTHQGIFSGSVIVDNPLSGLNWAGGATGTAGTAQNIGWTSSATNKPASVNIKYSTDSGATYPNLIAKVTNATSNSYPWKPLSVLGANVRIKVEDAAVPQVFIASTSDINITAPTMTITAVGTPWQTDTSQNITWTPDSTTNPAIPRVKLEYSRTGGAPWTTIAAAAPNTGTYSWDLTGIVPSPTMKIRVTALGGAVVTYGGNANTAGKAGIAWLESGNKVLAIAVNSSFAAGANVLTVSGLKFNNFASAASTGNLTLDINNDGAADAVDDKLIRINDNSVYSGGYGDGWSYAEVTN